MVKWIKVLVVERLMVRLIMHIRHLVAKRINVFVMESRFMQLNGFLVLAVELLNVLWINGLELI